MNYYYCIVEGNLKEVNMKLLSKYLPKNVEQLGFICSECGTYMMDSVKNLCTSCESFSQESLDGESSDSTISFVFGISKDKDEFYANLTNESREKNKEGIQLSISTDFNIDDDIISTLQNIYQDEHGVYTFNKYLSNRLAKIGQKITLREDCILEKCSDGLVYTAKEYGIKDGLAVYIDKNKTLYGASNVARLKLHKAIIEGYDYKGISEYIFKNLDDMICLKDILADINTNHIEAILLIEDYLVKYNTKSNSRDIFELLKETFGLENTLCVEGFDFSKIEQNILDSIQIFF